VDTRAATVAKELSGMWDGVIVTAGRVSPRADYSSLRRGSAHVSAFFAAAIGNAAAIRQRPATGNAQALC